MAMSIFIRGEIYTGIKFASDLLLQGCHSQGKQQNVRENLEMLRKMTEESGKFLEVEFICFLE